LLHTATQIQSADRQGSTNIHNASSTAKQNVTPVTNNFTNEVQTYCSFKNKVTNHVLLATAVVEVKNKFNQYVPCRVLLDSAAQVNFITEWCVQRLKLARNQSAISIQGINNVNTATHHSVSIHLRSRRTDWHTSLTCAVLPNITSNVPATKLDTTSWKLPNDILLADEHFDMPGAIDLLIGADLFYEILLSNQRTRKGYPVLQETVLGWIVSGKTPAINSSSSTHRSFFRRETTPLEANLNRFWEIQPEPCLTFTPEQQACEQHFLNHVHQQEDGRFIV
jgi:hypothetical protein